jgi:hypothetical protein
MMLQKPIKGLDPREYRRLYRASHREKIRAYHRAWKIKHPDKVRLPWNIIIEQKHRKEWRN